MYGVNRMRKSPGNAFLSSFYYLVIQFKRERKKGGVLPLSPPPFSL